MFRLHSDLIDNDRAREGKGQRPGQGLNSKAAGFRPLALPSTSIACKTYVLNSGVHLCNLCTCVVHSHGERQVPFLRSWFHVLQHHKAGDSMLLSLSHVLSLTQRFLFNLDPVLPQHCTYEAAWYGMSPFGSAVSTFQGHLHCPPTFHWRGWGIELSQDLWHTKQACMLSPSYDACPKPG